MGLIYRIVNNINGKDYIGLSTETLEERWKKHKSQLNDNSYIHNAMKLYGMENFSIELIEDNIPNDETLDEKEIYYIEKFHTYINDPLGNGYNLTRGGRRGVGNGVKKLELEDVEEIKYLLLNTDLSIPEIAKKYEYRGIKTFAINDINTGRSWNDGSLKYPLRPYNVNEIEEWQFYDAIELLQTHMFSSQWICNKLNILTSTLSHINNGKYGKNKGFKYPENITFPIQPYKIVTNNLKISNRDRINLLIDWINGLSREELKYKYNISSSYVKCLINNQNSPHFLDDIKFPLRNFKEYNLINLNKKIDIIDKYES